MNENDFKSRLDLKEFSKSITALRSQLSAVVLGQEQLTDMLIVALLSNGHVLIEGMPGVAKTLSAKLLARCVDASFRRIQFTPDLMPSDIIGTSVYNFKTSEFEFKKGPLFANILLADEINRSPAKTQSALFEAMEERQITVDGTTYKLNDPFMVLATQNPVEHEGTYRLPEAQLDRFLFKLSVDYPGAENESRILKSYHEGKPLPDIETINPVIGSEEIVLLKQTSLQVIAEEKLLDYIVKLVGATRQDPSLFFGASPRASIAILVAAKVVACMQERDFLTPEDIRYVCAPVLRHRIALTPEKEMEGIDADTVIRQIIDKIEVPR